MTGLVSLADIEDARAQLAGVARATPLEPCPPLGPAFAGPAHLKCENLQRAGSFKLRGGYVRLAWLTPAERARGVVAASAGNHAQGVALAARLQHSPATVFMPVGASLPKITATREHGAAVELVGHTVEESLAAAEAYADRTGAVLVHPFDHPDVIAGQGTLGLEILEQCPGVASVVVPVGGGGLISGVAAAVKARRPEVRVIGVQAAGAAAFPPSLRAGHPVKLSAYRTIADGIAVGQPGELTFAHVRALVDDVVTVTDEDISRALLTLLERAKLVVEPAGAVAVAGLLAGVVEAPPPVVAVLSGGNLDPLLMLRVIEHGLAAAQRFLRFTVCCPDRPGQLAALLERIAEVGANVVDVAHQRYDPQLRIGEVEVALSVETRGADHAAQLAAALRAAGYHLDIAVNPGTAAAR